MNSGQSEYKSPMTKFLNRYCAKAKNFVDAEITNVREDFNRFIRITSEFDDNTFINPNTRKFSVALFEVVYNAVTRQNEVNAVTNVTPEKIKQLQADREFRSSSEKAAADKAQVEQRFEAGRKYLWQ